ncbi:hypothetical protein D0Y65_041583 [Glycine soja]|uniref:GIR1-like zinc ribbon domain-containing protein n=1 Tax=Glycine soja TaxID=3848 RepID=A0A445GWI8_GLYSO|nr:hypothetical protein JHK86_043122 [Glycine max]RZB65563.1 hypothetical protein D0Y65_041583 [Glycine soja]
MNGRNGTTPTMVSPPSQHCSCGSTEPNQEDNNNNNNDNNNDDNNHNNNDDDNNNNNNNNNNGNNNNNNNNNGDNNNNNNNNNGDNHLEAPSLVLVGFPHCLMYQMISEDNLKCPKCKSINLIHFT